jgi:hypothetical protein
MWFFSPHAFVLVILAAVAIVAAWFSFWAVAQGHFAARPFGVLAVFAAETIVVGTIYWWHDPLHQRSLFVLVALAYAANGVSALVIWANQWGERRASRARSRR